MLAPTYVCTLSQYGCDFNESKAEHRKYYIIQVVCDCWSMPNASELGLDIWQVMQKKATLNQTCKCIGGLS